MTDIGPLVKLVSVGILGVVAVMAVILVFIEKVTGQPVDGAAYAIIGAAISYALSQLGLHQGIVLMNSNTAVALKTLAAKVNAEQKEGTE